MLVFWAHLVYTERTLAKADLLILDELSYLSFNRHQLELLFKVISDRSEKGSTLMTIRVCFQSHQQAKLCKPEQCSRQMNESEESASELFEAHSDSAMIFDLHEKAFNKMPFFVVIEIGVPWIN